MYQEYKNARNKAWQVIIEVGINSLPVRLSEIAKYYNIQIIGYCTGKYENNPVDGYTVNYNGNLIIYYNNQKPRPRIRFTIAHELGHCLLGHLKKNFETQRRNSESLDEVEIKEIQANVFARNILMPATVLYSLNVNSAKDIANICNVSMQSAKIRFNRLLELSKRGMYNNHPLEKQVLNQFENYIYKNRI